MVAAAVEHRVAEAGTHLEPGTAGTPDLLTETRNSADFYMAKYVVASSSSCHVSESESSINASLFYQITAAEHDASGCIVSNSAKLQ